MLDSRVAEGRTETWTGAESHPGPREGRQVTPSDAGPPGASPPRRTHQRVSPSNRDPNGPAEPPEGPPPGDGESPPADPVEAAKEAARQRAEERRALRAEKRQARAAWIRDLRHGGLRLRERRRERQTDRGPKPRLKRLRVAFVVSGLLLLAIVSWVFGIMMAVAQDLPDLEARAQYDRAKNSVVYANDGETVLTTLTGNEQSILLEADEISPVIKQAVVAVEDERFYDHRGIDFLGIARALQQDIVAGSAVQGGSTITQQFVKNALEAQGSRTVLQKLRESALAYQIERKWSKEKILTNYLNNIYFGNGAYGIEAAARTYFGFNHRGCGPKGERCASVLRPEEAALLAALISSPTAYDPLTNPVNAKSQRNVVLEKMREQGVLEISDEDFPRLLEVRVPVEGEVQPPTTESEAPFFTDWLRQQVVDKYGAGRTFGGGLKVTSTLDAELQEAAEQSVSSRLGGLGPTSAVVVLDNGSAEVLAMVGGQDFEASPFNLATNGQRQPGSAFKPFTLVTALREGLSPDQVYTSAPQELPFETTIKTKSGKKKEVEDVFEVSNYGDKYLGSASISTATTYSDNAVYAQLGLDVGLNDIVDTAHDLGVSSDLDSNPALILGGLETGVTPLEMAYAYNTLANDGARVSGTAASRGNGEGPVAIRSVTVTEEGEDEFVPDQLGGTGENEKTEEQVVDPTVAQTATDILRTVVTSGTGQRAQVGDDYIWGKTGTTDNNADAWFVGANEDVTVAVWVGYAEGGTPMLTEFGGLPVDGGTIPALIWNDVVTAWDSLKTGRRAEDPDSKETETSVPTTEVTPETTTEVVEPAPVAEEPAPEPEPEPVAPEPATPATEPEPAPEAGGTGATSSGGSSP